jgi:hypothetical protein
LVTADRKPADYVSERSRGTVDFDPLWKNYAFHRVRVPAGATVVGCNFTQLLPNTTAIVAAGPVTLIDCNLVNVALDPAWTVQGCNTSQAWLVVEADGRERRQWICDHPSKLTGAERVPSGAILDSVGR